MPEFSMLLKLRVGLSYGYIISDTFLKLAKAGRDNLREKFATCAFPIIQLVCPLRPLSPSPHPAPTPNFARA